jgi:hypothetical protein
MKAILAIGAIVLALLVAPSITQSIDDWNSAANRQRAAELARQQWEDQLERERREATQAGVIAGDYFWRLLAGFTAVLGVMYAVDAYRNRQRRVTEDRRLVYPDQRGMLPVARRQLEDDDLAHLVERALEAYHTARIEEARRPIPPAHLTYAPKFSNSVTGADPAALPSPAIVVPTFAELLSSRRVGRGNPLILGFDQESGKELSGTWLDLYSTAIAGLPGTGKTTTQRFLASQVALQGARFVVIDPHAGAADDSLAATLSPLAGSFVCDPASTDKQILEAVRYVADVGARRIAGKDKDTTPLILWADELTALLGRSTIGDELAQLLETVAQEYRKRFVFVCGSGQIWTAARATSELRDSFASAIVHRMKRNQARLLLPTEEAAGVERLETGHAVLWRTSGATVTIAVPNTTAADVVAVAGLLTDTQPTVATTWQPLGNGSAIKDMAPVRAASVSPDAARILSLFREGVDIPTIVKQVYGVSNGRQYTTASAEVNQVIRAALATR